MEFRRLTSKICAICAFYLCDLREMYSAVRCAAARRAAARNVLKHKPRRYEDRGCKCYCYERENFYPSFSAREGRDRVAQGLLYSKNGFVKN